MRTYVSCLVEGHNQVRSMLSDEVAGAKRVYEEFTARYKSSSASARNAPFVMAYTEPTIGNPVYLGADVVAETERMAGLHPSATNLSMRYVSTEVVFGSILTILLQGLSECLCRCARPRLVIHLQRVDERVLRDVSSAELALLAGLLLVEELRLRETSPP